MTIKVYRLSAILAASGASAVAGELSVTFFEPNSEDAQNAFEEWCDGHDHEIISQPEVTKITDDPDEFLSPSEGEDH